MRRLFRRPVVRVIAAVLAVFLCWVAFSVGQALTAAGGGSVSSKLAEWARDHYLGPVVTFAEWMTYNPPKVGGKPSFSLAVPSGEAVKHKYAKAHGFKPIIPAQLSTHAGTPLPGRGRLARDRDGPRRARPVLDLPAAVRGIQLLRGRHRVHRPAAGHLPAAPGLGGPGPG